MRLNTGNVYNVDYLGRKAVYVELGYYDSDMGPHLPYTRVNYTIPQGKVLKLLSIDMTILRTAQASSAGLCAISVRALGEGYTSLIAFCIEGLTNELVATTKNITCNIPLYEGMTLVVEDYDFSNGGNHLFTCGIVGLLYDYYPLVNNGGY